MCNAHWMFFDLGSTLIDETDALSRRVRETVAGTDVSREAFQRVMKAGYAIGLDGYKRAVDAFHLSKAPWHSEEERPYDDCLKTLQALRAQGFRLGMIANQLPGTERRLAEWGMLPYFEIVAASAECGVTKPDPEIFLYALRKAGCRPQDAVMIGDRVDNDLLPAKALGMQTVRVLKGPFAAFPSPDGCADASICTLTELTELFPLRVR